MIRPFQLLQLVELIAMLGSGTLQQHLKLDQAILFTETNAFWRKPT